MANLAKIRNFVLIVVLIAGLFVGGCSEPATIAGGLAIGGATLAGIEADLQKSKDRIIAEKIAAQARADLSEEQKSQLIIELDKKQATIEAIQAGTGLARDAAKTDWTDPQQAAPWLTAAIASALAYLKNKKEKNIAGVLDNYKTAVSRYQAKATPGEAQKLSAELPG